MKELSNSDKIIAFISPNMIDLVTFPDNNRKSDVYTGGDIHGIYCYLEMIGDPTTLNTSGHSSHNFGPSYHINNDTVSIHLVLAAIHMIHKSICELCRRI